MSYRDTRRLMCAAALGRALAHRRFHDRVHDQPCAANQLSRLGALIIGHLTMTHRFARHRHCGPAQLAPPLGAGFVSAVCACRIRLPGISASDERRIICARSRSAALAPTTMETSAAASAAARAYWPCRCGSVSDYAVCKSLSASCRMSGNGAVMGRTVRRAATPSPPPDPTSRPTFSRGALEAACMPALSAVDRPPIACGDSRCRHCYERRRGGGQEAKGIDR